MKLLITDTSGPVCGAAVMDGEKVLSESTCQNRNTHSVSLMPMVESCLARAGQVYAALFRGEERLMADAPLPLEEILRRAAGMDAGPILLCGDGADVHRETIAATLGDRAVFAGGPFRYLRPAAAGILAQRKGEMTDYLHLRETYLRPPNAEKNKKLLEAMRRG